MHAGLYLTCLMALTIKFRQLLKLVFAVDLLSSCCEFPNLLVILFKL